MIPLDEVKETICEGFKSMPQTCEEPVDPQPSTTNSSTTRDASSQNPPASHTFATIVLVVFVMLIFMFVVFLFYRRHVKREMAEQMQNQINATVSQYFAIAEGKAQPKVNFAAKADETKQVQA